MKFPKFGMSPAKKQMLFGGLAGSLIFFAEEAANEMVTGYPQQLKDKLSPGLPRNGTLIAAAAPLAGAWVVAKYKHSAKIRNLKNGVTFYSAPKLVHQLVVNMLHQAGTGTFATTPMGLGIYGNNRAVIINRTVPTVSSMSGPVGQVGAGRYMISNPPSPSPPTSGGAGRYTLALQ